MRRSQTRILTGVTAVLGLALIIWLAIHVGSTRIASKGVAPGGATSASDAAVAPRFAEATPPSEPTPPEAASSTPRATPPPNRVPVAPGSKAWRFERPLIEDTSAGALYSRLSQRGIDHINARDAAVFAEIMQRCRRWERELKLLEQEKRRAAGASDWERQQTDLLAQEVKHSKQARSRLCADAPEDAATKADEWLTLAAELGEPLAMYYFASGTHLSWVTDLTEIYKAPERLAAYKPKAIQYLQVLASLGHYDALIQLSSMYMGEAHGPDPALSWAYWHAALRAKGDTTTIARAVRQLDTMTPEMRLRAEREAGNVYEQCCR